MSQPHTSVPPHLYPQPDPQSLAPQPYPPPYLPAAVFCVRLMKHTGLAVAWFNRRYTVTGTFDQCEAAIRKAQQYNLAPGWWSFSSLLVWNWVALVTNMSARKALHRNAGYANWPHPRPRSLLWQDAAVSWRLPIAGVPSPALILTADAGPP